MSKTNKFSLKKALSLIFIVMFSLVLISCRRDPINNNGNGEKTELEINYSPGNAMRTLTYNTGTPLTLPNGESYTNGDLKPIWNYIAKDLDIVIKDAANQGQNARDMIEIAAAREFKGADIYGGDIAEQLMYNGANGYFVNLNDHKDKLPDFFQYLEDLPLIKDSITAYDGGIYHIPYVAEQDEFSRVFYGRSTWIKLLLDDDNVMTDINKETLTIDAAYQPYWKDDILRHSKNVIEEQNNTNISGKLKASATLQVLRDYIDSEYPDLNKRSDLYLGVNAKYDIDELVALFRVIKLSPKTLSKEATGMVVDDVNIVPYFFRTKNQREELFKLVNYFGGTRAYGSNTNTNKFFIDENDELQYSFIQDDFFEGIEFIQNMFSEGLINPDWDDVGNSVNYRTMLYGSDDEVDSKGNSTVKQLGFMTFDFFASTGSSSPKGAVEAILPPLTNIKGEDANDLQHYIEIPRTIMINGWAIASHVNEEKLDAALSLLNYLFTEKGSFVQNFGLPDITADFDNLWETPKGDMVPTLKPWLTEHANSHGSGDIGEFARNFLGVRMAIGYKADIGFELQFMVDKALEGYQLYVDANVRTLGYQSENNYMLLSPPVFSLNRQEKRQLNQISVGDQQLDYLYSFIKSSSNAPKNTAAIKQSYYDSNIEEFLAVYRRAYQRIKDSR